MLYPLLRPLLFRFDAETAHEHTLHLLDKAHQLRLLSLAHRPPRAHRSRPWG
jgi:dihydroorotate dehydrogenase